VSAATTALSPREQKEGGERRLKTGAVAAALKGRREDRSVARGAHVACAWGMAALAAE